MTESEIVKLFVVINKTYDFFEFEDQLKVELWLNLLSDVPFELAEANVRRYILDPKNKRAPHPGVLAETSAQRAEGRYIPDAQETRQMLARWDTIALPEPIPETARERMIQLGYKRTFANSE